jgi:transposase
VSGWDLTRLSHRKAAVLAHVRDGKTLEQAAGAVGLTLRAVEHWRQRDPRWRRDLDHARSVALARREWPLKQRLLAELRVGEPVTVALQRIGYGRSAHTHLVRRWLREDAAFATEYRRLLGPTGRNGVAIRRFFRWLDECRSIAKAAKLAGMSPSTVYLWRERYPDLWARVEEARAA